MPKFRTFTLATGLGGGDSLKSHSSIDFPIDKAIGFGTQNMVKLKCSGDIFTLVVSMCSLTVSVALDRWWSCCCCEEPIRNTVMYQTTHPSAWLPLAATSTSLRSSSMLGLRLTPGEGKGPQNALFYHFVGVG